MEVKADSKITREIYNEFLRWGGLNQLKYDGPDKAIKHLKAKFASERYKKKAFANQFDIFCREIYKMANFINI